MESSDSMAERFREQLERLKHRYREEALRAVAEADKEGFLRGKREALSQYKSQQLQTWQSLSKVIESGDSESNSNGLRLVQWIVEQIYKGLRDDCQSNNEDHMSLAQIKVSSAHSSSSSSEDSPIS